jgi:hypothetical protein
LIIKKRNGSVHSFEGWQFSRALQGRLRRDGAIFELTVDKISARAAVTIGPENVKLKNFHC